MLLMGTNSFLLEQNHSPKRFVVQESKQEVTKVVSLTTVIENLPGLLTLLTNDANTYIVNYVKLERK